MTSELKSVVVKFAADLTQFEKAVTSMQTKLNNASQKMTAIGKKMTLAITAPLVGLSVLAVKEAANMEGALDKFNVVFRGGTEEMLEWAEGFRKEFPLARTEVIKFAADLQGLIVPMGVNRSAAADMTMEWMHLAGALSAFHDVPMADALNAIRSGIAGESEPLKRFGVVISEANIQQEALSLGLIKAGQEMSGQVRQQALLSLAYRQSADAVNGLEEQKGSLLWQLQELKATYKDFMLDLGNTFLPIVKKIVPELQKWAEKFGSLNDQQRTVIAIVMAVVAAIGPLLLTLGLAAKGAVLLAGGFGLLISPVALVIVAVAALVAMFVTLYKNNEEFKTAVDETWREIKEILTEIIGSIVKLAGSFWNEFGEDIMDVWAIVNEYLVKRLINAFDMIKNMLALLSAILKGDWSSVWDSALGIFGNFADGIENKVKFITDLFYKLWDVIEETFSFDLSDTFKDMVNGLIIFLNKAIQGFESVFKLTVPHWVPAYGGESWSPNFKSIPQLADGGIVMPRPGGVLANLAEAGKPEAVIPLDRLSQLGGGSGVFNLYLDIDGGRLIQRLGIPLMREIRIRG